ncbi:tRNA lysidine(34) synthetase TilS [Williamsia sp. CHRR-6]|uniref:tRNA lysidine(34) synthetase TilS n=1 Tax=Williamsia sp. CHRR-6 TaxID=2835871 RepID=UPI001BD9469A|nr:tRNA lysidine(34) synthetase TilS [Williamsia sp. CHRR-6]MBT0566150.1 tRNA lysidine(34) synthetase TilS [Williamsia sp. CHRR-6]
MITAVRGFAAAHLDGARSVCVALSGGADSLALTAAAVGARLDVHAVVIDHGLQDNSATVADTAADHARELGATARVVSVQVGTDGGPEAAARTARYAALEAARDGRPVLVAHTLDDQAETVLLGLSRGSGPRSLAGMVAWNEPWGRPLLGVRRTVTHRACAELRLRAHLDAHNTDPRFMRSRLRSEVLPLLEDVLQGGVAPALARTAEQLRSDSDALDQWAQAVWPQCTRAGTHELVCAPLIGVPHAIRMRVLRRWLGDNGATEITERLLRAVDTLVRRPLGDVPRRDATVAIGGGASHRRVVRNAEGLLSVALEPR